jgi:hypothetical protein
MKTKIKLKKIRLFANRNRVTRTRIVYVALTVGTVIVAFLFVLLNRLIFRLTESSLYDKTEYEAVSIISADSIGAPFSRETRVEMFLQCEREGAERAVMPNELSQSDVLDLLKPMWNETLELHSNGEKLRSGESLRTVLKKSRYTATLRDFYHEATGAKLALWCAQAYYTADSGQVYCLSVQFDSRTGDVYAETCALFRNIRADDIHGALLPFLRANGYADSLLDSFEPAATENGFTGTLKLPDGLSVKLTYTTGEQYEITFR